MSNLADIIFVPSHHGTTPPEPYTAHRWMQEIATIKQEIKITAGLALTKYDPQIGLVLHE